MPVKAIIIIDKHGATRATGTIRATSATRATHATVVTIRLIFNSIAVAPSTEKVLLKVLLMLLPQIL